MPLIVSSQLTDEWFAARIGKISASIAAGCLALHPHMSRAEAWRTALGTNKKVDNRHVRWGSEFEPVARAAYEIQSGNLVMETGLWQHPVHDWLIASPDGLIGNDEILEVKCVGTLPTAVPIYHRIQMLVQMLCTGRHFGTYFVWTHSGTFLRRVHLAGEAWLLRKLKAFYEEFVLTSLEPPRKARKKKTA